jgi:hypothetical protein
MTGRELNLDGLCFFLDGLIPVPEGQPLKVQYSFATPPFGKYASLHGRKYPSQDGNIVLAFSNWWEENQNNNTILSFSEWVDLKDDFLLALRRGNFLYDTHRRMLDTLSTTDGLLCHPQYGDHESWDKIKHNGTRWRHSDHYTESEQNAITSKQERYEQEAQLWLELTQSSQLERAKLSVSLLNAYVDQRSDEAER